MSGFTVLIAYVLFLLVGFVLLLRNVRVLIREVFHSQDALEQAEQKIQESKKTAERVQEAAERMKAELGRKQSESSAWDREKQELTAEVARLREQQKNAVKQAGELIAQEMEVQSLTLELAKIESQLRDATLKADEAAASAAVKDKEIQRLKGEFEKKSAGDKGPSVG